MEFVNATLNAVLQSMFFKRSKDINSVAKNMKVSVKSVFSINDTPTCITPARANERTYRVRI